MKAFRKFTLVLALTLLVTGLGKSIAQTVSITSSQPTPHSVNPDSGPNPDCIPGVTCGSSGN